MGKTRGAMSAPVRYAVRQVLDQEYRREILLQRSVARSARSTPLDRGNAMCADDEDKENAGVGLGRKQKGAAAVAVGVRRDFFGRIINDARPTSAGGGTRAAQGLAGGADEKRVWVSFHEGYSNAVRKPITLKELMDSF